IVYNIKTGKPMYENNPDVEVAHQDLEYLDQIGKRRSSRTPDYLTLKFQEYHPIFVYGNLKSGGPYSCLLKDAIYLGEGLTANISYDLQYYEGMIRQPVLRRINPNALTAARVMGEVYAVTPEQILEIDFSIENTEVFKRDHVFIRMLDQTYKSKGGECHP